MHQEINGGYIQQLIAGDEAAFDAIYDAYSSKVYRLAYRFLKDSEQSQEIVQECFINLWTGREKLNAEGNIWLYLYVIAKRLSLNALRKISQSRQLTEKLVHHVTTIHNDTEEDILVHDLEQFAEQIICKLPKQQQLIFRLSRTEHLTHKEIAEQLHISPNTVKNHMVEALKTLKSQLQYSDLIYLAPLFFFF
ncbi:RNA polymerase sigma factor [Mucilaginibacter dorajii]|uniref:RNA polymerase sigma-70 factor n=1 Tax=Mucilaginibacter dorajii TaxID=692994 RepID=A0ABP7RAD2_9SPHI|nr:RNA polymerase sigma-70 factor [Mucilaginibacter dorajii]MCS3736709.1 RNA polymerase sigma-70 factor (ECF subfamily) [Mucilaginibacter dorajii]